VANVVDSKLTLDAILRLAEWRCHDPRAIDQYIDSFIIGIDLSSSLFVAA
jgi:hypothetical protein